MISNKGIIRLSVVFAIIFWILLVVVDLFVVFSYNTNNMLGTPIFLSRVLLVLFIFSLIIYYRYTITKAESVNFLDLLWRVFVTGLLTTIVSLMIRTFDLYFGQSALANNDYIFNFFYLINLGLVIAFLVSTFIVWKRLILYQKSKNLLKFWSVFEYALYASMAFNFLGYTYEDAPFVAVLVTLTLMGLMLAFNLKWVAYLNFGQKWKSILFILLAIIYLGYFYFDLIDIPEGERVVHEITGDVFIMALFIFIFIYSIISVLVILFNLPTSSVFEKKLEEVMSFQRLSQSIPAGSDEKQVYEILLDSAVSAVFADAAWIEVVEHEHETLITRNITEADVPKIKEAVKNSNLKKILNTELERNPHSLKLTATLKGVGFKSILVYPLMAKNQQVGTLALLKEVDDSFNKEMIDIIETFVNQTNISIENFRLLNEAIVNERYREELKIATKVQKSLLPDQLECSETFEITAFSNAADEVGGDYYDLYRLNKDRLVLIVGDVSGKGTSAAFHMSQMKGVFQSLVQLDLSPKEFLVNANSALSRCLDRSSFITVSYFVLDTAKKKVEFTRAGHCPTLYYDAKENKTFYFQTKGLGLGILRNSEFSNYVEVSEFHYKPGDILMVYTDGIVEATNGQSKEYGYDRLRKSLEKHKQKDPTEIQEGVINDLYNFSGKTDLHDDYTLLIVKFK